MKKIILFIIVGMFLIGIVSATNETLINYLRSTDKIREVGTNGTLKSYYSGDKKILIEDDKLNPLLDLQLTSDYKVYVTSGNEIKVAEFKLNDINTENIFDSIKFYDVNKDYSEVQRDFKLKYGTDYTEEECIDGICNLVTKTRWFDFSNVNEIPSKNIKIGLFTNVKQGDKIEWISNIKGFENPEWAEFDYVTNWTTSPTISISAIRGLTFDGNYTWIVSDGNDFAYAFFTNGTYTGFSFDITVTGVEGTNPRGIAYDEGFFWTADSGNDYVYKWYAENKSYAGENWSVGFDAWGIETNNSFIWITSPGTDKVYKFFMNGTYTNENWDINGSGSDTSYGITKSGNYFWITDATDNLVYKYFGNGTYTNENWSIATTGNDASQGIANNGTNFFIGDFSDAQVYVYEMPKDTTPPTFTTVPSNATLEYINYLSVDFDADETGTWSVNNTAFSISASGLLTNNTILGVGVYPLNISILDDAGNPNDVGYRVTINKNTHACSTLFSATSPIINTTSFYVFSNCNSAFNIYRNGTGVENNSEQSLATGFYNFSVIRTDQENYSNIYDEENFRIDAAPPGPPAPYECSTMEKTWYYLVRAFMFLTILMVAVGYLFFTSELNLTKIISTIIITLIGLAMSPIVSSIIFGRCG